MLPLLLSFFSSVISTWLIIRSQHLHGKMSADYDLSGPQKFHIAQVPRIGGVSIAFGIFISTIFFFSSQTNLGVIIFISCLPAFLIGLTEDITKKVGVLCRLLVITISCILAIYLLNIQIRKVDIFFIDPLMNFSIVALLFTLFAMVGLTNAYNIIDGFNGLASLVGILTLLGIAYVGHLYSDRDIMILSLCVAAAIFGFFIWNYPYGHIFMGDGGAYLIGFWIASISILITQRHQQISPWFALLINGYPILETLFTIYRRIYYQGKSPGSPDGIHFHTLIYRRVLMKSCNRKKFITANSLTSPYLWFLSSLSIFPAILWPHSTPILAISMIVFIFLYIWLYGRIVKFKTPNWIF